MLDYCRHLAYYLLNNDYNQINKFYLNEYKLLENLPDKYLTEIESFFNNFRKQDSYKSILKYDLFNGNNWQYPIDNYIINENKLNILKNISDLFNERKNYFK